MLDSFGGELPHGKTVTNPRCVDSVTARFNTTATEPAGTPTRPATNSSVTVPPPRTPIPLNCPSAVDTPPRVSNTRPGTSDTNPEPVGNAPVTSTTTWVSEYVKMQILPASPIFAV